MKTINVSKKVFMAIIAFGLTTVILHAQTTDKSGLSAPPPPPAGMQAPPPPNVNGTQPPAPNQRGVMAPPQQQLQQVSSYKGTVIRFATNDDYVYDGFYMLNSGDSLLVKFPPHLGTQITAALKPGATVSVSGVKNIAPTGKTEVRMITISANNKTIADTGTHTAAMPAETYTSGNGKITSLQTNPDGIVNGVVINSKTILRIPPHVANQLNSLVQTNASVTYTGMKKDAANGEASAADYTIVHCKTITLNGQQYFIQ